MISQRDEHDGGEDGMLKVKRVYKARQDNEGIRKDTG